MLRALLVFGTRPEAIKMAPVVRALRDHPAVDPTVCVTGQHRHMLDQVLEQFEVTPDRDLDLMAPGQSLGDVTARVLTRMPDVLATTAPDVVVVQGDTTTAMATALAAFYARIDVAHVEAGLRSGRLDAPFPEELNRVWIDGLAKYVYPPTARAAAALRAEGRDDPRSLITGNTSIDALLTMRDRLSDIDVAARDAHDDAKRLVLVTAHRRESFGEPLRNIMGALRTLARTHADVTFVYPVHPNPNVTEAVRVLDGMANVRLVEPVDYASLVWLLDRAELAITDSGGIQEEAPAVGCPLLVLRDVTERQEVVEAGAGRLVGTDPDRIVHEATQLLADPRAREVMASPRFLFGDGRAAQRIAAHLAGEPVAPWSQDAK